MSSQSYGVSALHSWFEENQSVLSEYGFSSELQTASNGSARVRLESERHVAEVCAWDHASCLDIQLLSVETEESIFPHVGPCDTRLEFEEHLRGVVSWAKQARRAAA
jgi:hypothetical protein